MGESGQGQDNTPTNGRASERLDSWKEIAAYLDRDVTTAHRWEKKEGLPVHRHVHDKQATVYAYRSEIDTWLANRSLEKDTPAVWFSLLRNTKAAISITIGVVLALLAGLLTWMGTDLSPNPEVLNFRQRDWVPPDSFEHNVSAATEFIHVDSNLLRARKYLDRARNMLTDDFIRGGGSSVVKVMFFSAQEAWLRGDPETALAEIGKVSQKLESLGISGNAMLPVATLYYSLGKVQLPHRLFTDSLDKKSPIRGLHQLAFYYEATKPHLRQYLGISEGSTSHLAIPGGSSPMAILTAAIVLARTGFIGESETLITELERNLNERPHLRSGFQMARGVLSLTKGNTTEGMRLIEDMLGQTRGLYFLGSLILAEAWREQDQLELAMRVLEQASSKKALLFAPVGGENPARWLRIRLMLAKIYREMGRDDDALEIEAELRRSLALADPDHPILRQLDRTKELALREGLSERAVQLLHSFP